MLHLSGHFIVSCVLSRYFLLEGVCDLSKFSCLGFKGRPSLFLDAANYVSIFFVNFVYGAGNSFTLCVLIFLDVIYQALNAVVCSVVGPRSSGLALFAHKRYSLAVGLSMQNLFSFPLV